MDQGYELRQAISTKQDEAEARLRAMCQRIVDDKFVHPLDPIHLAECIASYLAWRDLSQITYGGSGGSYDLSQRLAQRRHAQTALEGITIVKGADR